jgi:hypothetical protein
VNNSATEGKYVDLDYIKELAKSPHLSSFMSKAYGLELLFKLESFDQVGADNGIDDTYDSIEFNRPRKAAFSQFCSFLRDQNAIIYGVSSLKKSKTVLRLSTYSLEELALVRQRD